MAYYQQTNHDRIGPSQSCSTSTSPHDISREYARHEEETSVDIEKRPDRPIQFSKMSKTGSHSSNSELGYPTSPRYRKASLLTQALTSPELMPLSDAEAPVLTSDGGLTSPARTSTPSPPLPALTHPALVSLEPKDFLDAKQGQETPQMPQDLNSDRNKPEKVEESLGRKRCISFACTQEKPSQIPGDKHATATTTPEQSAQTAVLPKRACMLRFACPMKPSRSEPPNPPQPHQIKKPPQSENPQNPQQLDKPQQIEKVQRGLSGDSKTVQSPTTQRKALSITVPGDEKDTGVSHKSIATSESDNAPRLLSPSTSVHDRRLQFNRVDFQKSEATRFHEFAGSFAEEGEWANEQTAFRQKITINDTLRKENAIRKLAEEAEEEAREEDEDAYENADDDLDEASDDGNETDDEEGFADSDDGSDCGSTYQFWTPGNNTAATSTDHMEHIRPTTQRVASESSIESVINETLQKDESPKTDSKHVQKRAHSRKGTRSGTTELPDSGDFVVGTIDEDQPFEEEYMSRLKQKERSKQKIIPQDIDPSFPTSDPEAENDDDDEPEDDVEDELQSVAQGKGVRPAVDDTESSDDHDAAGRQSSGPRRTIPNPSPRRLHSPPPPSRGLFGQGVQRLHSPPPAHRKLISPPSSRRPSLTGSPNRSRGIGITRLAQRPNLTHTTSLPRTPNPFWSIHTRSQFHRSETPSAGTSPKTLIQTSHETHRRGPIEIVQGIENRRQRRKEKLWRHQCSKAHAGKEKERRCLPGRGAQRMKEVGLVMADRFKGYKQGTKLVLSV